MQLSDKPTVGYVWIVFCHAKEKGMIYICGIYLTEAKAVDNCRINEGVGMVRINCPIPNHVGDFEKLYYPFIQTWENAPLYHWQQKAQKVVSDFFAGIPCGKSRPLS